MSTWRGPEFWETATKTREARTEELERFWKLKRTFEHIREWARALQKRVRANEASIESIQKRLAELEKRK